MDIDFIKLRNIHLEQDYGTGTVNMTIQPMEVADELLCFKTVNEMVMAVL